MMASFLGRKIKSAILIGKYKNSQYELVNGPHLYREQLLSIKSYHSLIAAQHIKRILHGVNLAFA